MVHLSGSDVYLMSHDLDIKIQVTSRSKVKFIIMFLSGEPLHIMGFLLLLLILPNLLCSFFVYQPILLEFGSKVLQTIAHLWLKSNFENFEIWIFENFFKFLKISTLSHIIAHRSFSITGNRLISRMEILETPRQLLVKTEFEKKNGIFGGILNIKI